MKVTLCSPTAYLAAICAFGLAFATISRGKEAAPLPEKKARVFRVPPNLLSRSWSGHPDDADKSSNQNESFPRFRHVLPALGPDLPIDSRPFFRGLGVDFSEGDMALLSSDLESKGILFLRAADEVADLIDAILGGGDEYLHHVWVTYRLRHADKGRPKDLVERTMLCRAGQRVNFQRHKGDKLLEKAEAEVTVWEDGVTVEVSSEVEFHLKEFDFTACGTAFVRSGDPDGTVLCTVGGTNSAPHVELLVSARITPPLPSLVESPLMWDAWATLARTIDEQVAAAERIGKNEKRQSELFVLAGFRPAGDGGNVCIDTNLTEFDAERMMDARAILKEHKVELRDGDSAWFADKSGLLYLHAGDDVVAAAMALASQYRSLEMPHFELQFASTAGKRKKVRQFPPRKLLLKSGSRASAKFKVAGGEETIEAEGAWGEARTVADVNLALTGHPMGNESWTFSTQTLVATDGTSPVPLVSGRAADSGGGFKKVTLTAHHRGGHWEELLRDPVRKAAAISQFEAALKISRPE